MSEPRISLEAALAELHTLGGEAALLDETRCRAILADRLPDERARTTAALTALRAGVVDRLRAAPPAMGREAVLREAALLTQDYAITSALALEAVQAWARVFGLDMGPAGASPGGGWMGALKGVPAGNWALPAALKRRGVQIGLLAVIVCGWLWSQITSGGNAYEAYGISKTQDVELYPKALVETAVQSKGINLIISRADSGNAAAEALYCFAHYFGVSVPEDNARAKEWCEKAAAHKNPLGHLGLYFIYYYGHGVEIDKIRAKSELLAAAEGGDARGQFWAASLYLFGDELTATDDSVALELTQKLARRGHLNSRFRLGWMYENGRGFPKDLEEALRRYRELADENFPAGIRGVGWMIYNGWGGATQSFTEAAALYQRASDLGDGNASSNLGRMYQEGEGVSQSRSEAVRLYRLAIQQGYDASAALRALGYSQ